MARFASILHHIRRHLPSLPPALESVHKATSAWNARGSAGVGRQDTPMSSPPESKSVFSDISSFPPWASRNATPKLDQKKANDERTQHPAPKMERGGDHAVSRSNRLSFKNYPKDCPPLRVQWYHAVDVGGDQVAKCEARLSRCPRYQSENLSYLPPNRT